VCGGMGLTAKKYWDFRFRTDWQTNFGPQQTAIFAAGFCLAEDSLAPSSILDYGAGTGDSAPIMKMRYPDAELFLWDFSPAARDKQSRYGSIATIMDREPSEQVDLVYCSNVIEHIKDIKQFLTKLKVVSKKWIVLQGPYDEKHANGDDISPIKPKGEHVWTINEAMFDVLPAEYDWKSKTFETPYAWEGEQIIFIGTKKKP
jgi:SAM-dependent methyltransferase